MALTLLVVAAAAPVTHAENVTTYGAGLRSCRAYLESRYGDIADTVVYVDWLSGYFSAANRTSNHRNNILGLTHLNEALARLDDECRARPGLHFAEAAAVLLFGAKPGPATHVIGTTTYGSADKSCQSFVEARDQHEAAYWAEFRDWLGGYLSGVNAMSLRTSNVLGDAELADAIHWLDTFCTAHPITPFGAAVDALVAAGPAPGSALVP
jgi:hypothetical protein